MVKRTAVNRQVAGSNPAGGANITKKWTYSTIR